MKFRLPYSPVFAWSLLGVLLLSGCMEKTEQSTSAAEPDPMEVSCAHTFKAPNLCTSLDFSPRQAGDSFQFSMSWQPLLSSKAVVFSPSVDDVKAFYRMTCCGSIVETTLTYDEPTQTFISSPVELMPGTWELHVHLTHPQDPQKVWKDYTSLIVEN